jgi:hypothetical protein
VASLELGKERICADNLYLSPEHVLEFSFPPFF